MEGNAKNALAPLEFIVSGLGGLLLVSMVVITILSFSGDHLGFNVDSACVTAPDGAVAYQLAPHQEVDQDPGSGLRGGATAELGSVDFCTSDPSVSQKVWADVDAAADYAFAGGLLFFLWRMIRVARREGLFIDRVVRRLDGLGLYVLVGVVLLGVAHSVARSRLLSSMTDQYSVTFRISLVGLLCGFGLMTLGRVVALTVPMREEIDATV